MPITRYTRWNGSILDSLNVEDLMDQDDLVREDVSDMLGADRIPDEVGFGRGIMQQMDV